MDKQKARCKRAFGLAGVAAMAWGVEHGTGPNGEASQALARAGLRPR